MEISRSSDGTRARLALRGRLDAAWSASVQTALSDCVRCGEHVIELDMSQVAFISSAGIRVLISLQQRCVKEKGKFVITGLSGELMDLIKITRLDKLFTITKDPKTAAESLA